MKYALLLLCILLPPSVCGQESRPEPDPHPRSLAEAEATESPTTYEGGSGWFNLGTDARVTGDWGGGRGELESRGVELSFALTTVYQHVAHSGVNTHNAHSVDGSYDLELTFDLGAMGLVEGGMVYVLTSGSWGAGISAAGDVGDYFGVNADAVDDRSVDVWELWYEQSFLDDVVRVRVGKIDLTVDFETNAYANDETYQFLNAALINAGNVPFPDVGLGAQVIVTPCDWFYTGVGVADADGDFRETGLRSGLHGRDAFFGVYEFGFLPVFDTGWGLLPGGYRFGLWYDPQRKDVFFDDLNGRRRTVPHKTDDVGFYISFDQAVFREHPDLVGDTQGLGLFLRYAFAHGDVNEIGDFWSVGGQYQGLVPTRDDDVLAFGAAQGVFSRQLDGTGLNPTRETVLELYYNAQVLPWLNVTPDLQYIINPGGENGRDAFVAGLRVQMAF